MMTRARSLFAILLALVLIGTGGGMAVARGEMAVDRQIVICTGHGVEVIRLDAEGKRVSGHVCPDCVIALELAEAAPLPRLAGALWAAAFVLPVAGMLPGRAALPARARDPPQMV